MSEPPAVQSPYLLPPGVERRRMMQRMGIRPCALDYDEAEWAVIEAEAARVRGGSAPAVTDVVDEDDSGAGATGQSY